MRLPRLLVLAALLPAAVPAQSSLTPTEQTIVRAVDVRNADALALLERVVNINSGTHNFAGVRAVGDVFRARLDALGFTTRWVDGAPFGRAGHLVAEHPAKGRKILLIGHLDTVFERSSRFRKFERLDDSTARGPGIIDMKGGDVIIVQALAALKDAGALDSLNVVVVMNGDEEDGGHPLDEARRALADAAHGAAAAIGFEDGAGDPRSAVVSRRGATTWTLRATGNAGHASQIFGKEIGAGAVFEASRILHQFYTTLSGERLLAFSPGLIAGGSELKLDSSGTEASVAGKTNVVAGEVLVTGDMRTVSPEQLERTQRAMRAIVAKHLPGTSAEITFDRESYPPMAPSAGNRRLLAMYDRASRDIGAFPMTAVDPAKAGAADIAFVAALVPMKIDGVGLSGHDDHSDKETADLRMLPVQTKRAALVIYRLRR
ncbi:MAG: M20/M25/M40 family metallo-hydrolase [Gemmatimonadaceae bacterium]|nr:M20/M25/M40 family metallo-hydrolase [Gemmatimonadaceae bacterium]NUQ93846.1 M20/M25/M40 family metallo-hydrolase [Gemmatimonadaceae bacterium]NUR20389.1 M20/M25/M40 family metallo-hydrolase [Gemmatimonadaceae bacterium]